jgi:hypothetical protein
VNIWRAVHREAMAAWRSLRYDLRRRPKQRQRTEVIPRVPASADEDDPAYDPYSRRTRRLRTALAVAALAVSGTAATYFGVVGGLTALLTGEAGPPSALPGVNVEPAPTGPVAGVRTGTRSDADVGSMQPLAPTQSTTSAAPVKPSEPRSTRPSRPPSPTSTRKPPVPTPAPHPTPSCWCQQPTPTPTGSPTPTPSPSPTPSPDPSQPPAPPEPAQWAVAPAP